MWDVLSGVAKMAWDVMSGVTKTAWDVLSGAAKTAWDVLSGVANLCGMFCQGWKKLAWDVLSRNVLSGSRYARLLNSDVFDTHGNKMKICLFTIQFMKYFGVSFKKSESAHDILVIITCAKTSFDLLYTNGFFLLV